jgi:hypothetical protein
MFGRIELAWPVTDAVIRQRIIDECLVSYLHDTQDAWDLLPDGTYQRTASQARSRKQSAQVALMARYSAEPKQVPLKLTKIPRKTAAPKTVKTVKNVKSVKPAKSVIAVKTPVTSPVTE